MVDNIPGRREVNTHSIGLSGDLTKYIEIQVDMDYLKPQSRDTSVQCELLGDPLGIEVSTSVEDFYLQSHQDSCQQENNLSDKLDHSLLSEPVTSVILDQQLDAGCDLTDSETSNQVDDGQPCVELCSSSTPVKDTDELANNMDSGVHSSDGEINSFNESKELMKLHDPISLPSEVVILDLETVPKE